MSAREDAIEASKELGITLLSENIENALQQVSLPLNLTSNEDEDLQSNAELIEDDLEVEISEEDRFDVDKEKSVFDGIDALNVKDFTGIKNQNDKNSSK